MKTLFHGTTLENWLNIKKEEGFASNQTNWNCSGYHETYFYDMDKECNDEEQCIQAALESANLAASIQNYNGNTLVVLELEVPENLVEDDYSCENMDTIASVVNNDDLDLTMIKKIHICKTGYLPSLRLYYVSELLKNNQYIETSTFNELELSIVHQTEFPFIQDLHEFDYETENVEFEPLEII